jgi:hypothetical protein
MIVRQATHDDVRAFATTQVRASHAAYQDIVPEVFLRDLSVDAEKGGANDPRPLGTSG